MPVLSYCHLAQVRPFFFFLCFPAFWFLVCLFVCCFVCLFVVLFVVAFWWGWGAGVVMVVTHFTSAFVGSANLRCHAGIRRPTSFFL